jgi:hypothetical protein
MLPRLLAAAALVHTATPSPADDARVEAGRRIYEQGILPDGSPLQALRPEGILLEGSMAACVNCHRRSGLGSVEGETLTPPVAGPLLFRSPRYGSEALDPIHHYLPRASWERAMTRPAYDERSLARALREGRDPAGRGLEAPMPRYALHADAVSALAAYLRQLSADTPPGVEKDLLHLATVVTPDVPAAWAEAVLGVLRAWERGSRVSGKRWKIHLWKLTGPPQEWRRQLQAFYRERPVFAVLSGAGGSEWRPVHRFCEETRTPCILPALEVAPDPGVDHYSIYFSPGVTLEAALLARHLESGTGEKDAATRVIQVYADTTGRLAAEALRGSLDPRIAAPVDRRLRLLAPAAALDGLSADDSLVLWLRPPAVEQLAASAPAAPAGRIFVSALLAPPESLALPPSWKQRLRYLSLFDDLGVQAQIARLRLERWLDRAGLGIAAEGDGRRLQADAYAACALFNAALAAMKAREVRWGTLPWSREHLLETLERVVDKYDDGTGFVNPDSHVAYYGRMSLAPGQRVAVRGGTLLRYAAPDSANLVPLGARIVP